MSFPKVLTSLLTSPLNKFMNWLFALVVDRIAYIKDLRTNFEMLDEKASELFIKRKVAKDEIDKYRKRKMATIECEHWLNKVEKIEHELNEIKEEYNLEDGRRLRRWNLGKRVVVTMNCISDLIKEFNSLRLVVDAPPQVVETMPAAKINAETSTNRTLCKILDSVRKPEKHKIGIWGMGGVGKTTLMKILNNLPELKQTFEIVIWVTVSKDYSVRKTQKEIADRLSLQLSGNESDDRVARKLYEHLETKKFVLLLDDVWDKIDLDVVGVACPNQNGSKVVLTTRFKKVCNEMETDEIIKVEPLPLEEAWKLFREKAGEVVDLSSIHQVARSVADKCAGLPLAIIVIGAFLRNEGNCFVWDNALKELNSPTTSNMEDREEKVFNIMRFSFDRLKDEDLKNCFLYAALFPEDYKIPADEIIEYWMVEGFIGSSLNVIETRNKGYAMLKQLVDVSLLEETIDDPRQKAVKMHDVIRDLALKITVERKGRKFFVKARTMMKQHPENKEWEQVERISLMQNYLRELPERPNCPTLLTLLLQYNMRLITIPESFFEAMHSLQVLDLSYTFIKSLPPSICKLVSLRGLYLKKCVGLETLPPEIGALRSLELLDVFPLYSCNFPSEIGNLSYLRVLKFDLHNTVYTSGTIRGLSLLEQLIAPCPLLSPGYTKALIEDICCLKKLKSLEFYFREVKHLEYFVRMSSVWKEGSIMAFNFTVGNNCGRWPFQSSKVLSFHYGKSIPNETVEVLRRAYSFNLDEHRGIRKLCEIGVGNMNSLRECMIHGCFKMEIVLDAAQITDIALPNLETWEFSGLPNLKSVWNDPLPHGSLACLKRLKFYNCHGLENIFSRKIVQQLSNLEDLEVDTCSSLTKVIHEEESDMMFDCFLPKLRNLCLRTLPNLVSILKGCSLNFPLLEEIKVGYCPNLKRLPQGIEKASNLQKIRCNKDGWWDELEWDDTAIKLQLQPLVSREGPQL